MALTHHYGFQHAGRSDALEADATPIGTVFIFDNRRERDVWVNFPSSRADGSQPMRQTLKSRTAASLMRRKLPVVDFSADANFLDPYN
jgi:hypothetical protein